METVISATIPDNATATIQNVSVTPLQRLLLELGAIRGSIYPAHS
jgi:hypothetical protein